MSENPKNQNHNDKAIEKPNLNDIPKVDRGSWIGGFDKDRFEKSERDNSNDYIPKPKISQADTNDKPSEE